jgi:hypothetical protein
MVSFQAFAFECNLCRYDAAVPLPTWRKWLVHAFDQNKIFNLQNAMYAVLAVRRLVFVSIHELTNIVCLSFISTFLSARR